MSSNQGIHQRVLLVDDSRDVREVYHLALEGEGYDVRSVGLAEEAVALVSDWRPDLIVTDIFMPGMGGFGLITHIRSDLAPPVPVIVALSGFPDARDEALRRGAVNFEVKPLSLDGLRDLVSRSLSGATPTAPRDDEAATRRAAARAIGEATVDALLAREPGALNNLSRGAQAMSRFFGHSKVVVFLLRQGELRVCASSHPHAYPIGNEAHDVLALANDVLESGSTLLLPDTHAQTLVRRASRNIRFLACVPYIANDVTAGVMCLVDDRPHDFSGSELALLEYTAARWSALISNPLARRMMDRSGLLTREAFERLMGFTLEWGVAQNASMGLLMLEIGEAPREGSCAELMGVSSSPRTLVGLRSQHRIAVLSMAETPDLVSERLAAARSSVAGCAPVRASAELTFDAPLPRLTPDALLAWAGDLLSRAASSEPEHFLAVSARTMRAGRARMRRGTGRSRAASKARNATASQKR